MTNQIFDFMGLKIEDNFYVEECKFGFRLILPRFQYQKTQIFVGTTNFSCAFGTRIIMETPHFILSLFRREKKSWRNRPCMTSNQWLQHVF